jgi:hypothetical protein
METKMWICISVFLPSDNTTMIGPLMKLTRVCRFTQSIGKEKDPLKKTLFVSLIQINSTQMDIPIPNVPSFIELKFKEFWH